MDFDVSKTLDCKGLSCPMPILKLAKEMKSLSSGETLKLLGTDPGSKSDVPKWCTKTKNELLGTEESGGIYIFYIKKC